MSCNSERFFPAVGDKEPHPFACKIQRVYLLELAIGAADTLYIGNIKVSGLSCSSKTLPKRAERVYVLAEHPSSSCG